MAWSIADYNDFLDTVQDAFGTDRAEAQELYTDLRDVLDIGPLTVDDLVEYADVASDLVALVIDEERALAPEEVVREPGEEPPEEELEYDYEFDWQDEWFEVGDEIEITADLHYE